jgi:hypothetical protein
MDEESELAANQRNSQLWLVSGIALPEKGRLYALDQFAGKPELVRLRFQDGLIRSAHAPRPCKTTVVFSSCEPAIEIRIEGSAAAVRLHETSPAFFVRRKTWADDEAGSPRARVPLRVLVLVRLDVKSDHRAPTKTVFRQFQGPVLEANSIVDTLQKEVPGGGWYEVQPREPLLPGEYALLLSPDEVSKSATVVYDFAIDTAAPENPGALTPDLDTPPSGQ